VTEASSEVDSVIGAVIKASSECIDINRRLDRYASQCIDRHVKRQRIGSRHFWCYRIGVENQRGVGRKTREV
jgi:hypothetical protein